MKRWDLADMRIGRTRIAEDETIWTFFWEESSLNNGKTGGGLLLCACVEKVEDCRLPLVGRIARFWLAADNFEVDLIADIHSWEQYSVLFNAEDCEKIFSCERALWAKGIGQLLLFCNSNSN